MASFLEEVSRTGVADRQLQQAEEAVRLYFGQFVHTGSPPNGNDACDVADEEVANLSEVQGEIAAYRVLRELKEVLRVKHYSGRTERIYSGWAERFLRYLRRGQAGSSQAVPTAADARRYLSYLATHRKVAASTQNQAFNALLFLYRHVLHVELQEMTRTVRAKRGRKLPVVLSVDEVRLVLGQLEGVRGLMLELVYGSGVRLKELVSLRVKDLDFSAGTLTVRDGKGGDDRITLLPTRLVGRLEEHLAVRPLHAEKKKNGVRPLHFMRSRSTSHVVTMVDTRDGKTKARDYIGLQSAQKPYTLGVTRKDRSTGRTPPDFPPIPGGLISILGRVSVVVPVRDGMERRWRNGSSNCAGLLTTGECGGVWRSGANFGRNGQETASAARAASRAPAARRPA